jgi:hypothetical protein
MDNQQKSFTTAYGELPASAASNNSGEYSSSESDTSLDSIQRGRIRDKTCSIQLQRIFCEPKLCQNIRSVACFFIFTGFLYFRSTTALIALPCFANKIHPLIILCLTTCDPCLNIAYCVIFIQNSGSSASSRLKHSMQQYRNHRSPSTLLEAAKFL